MPPTARDVLREHLDSSSTATAHVVPILYRAARQASNRSDPSSPALSASFLVWRDLLGEVVGVSSQRLDRVVADWSSDHHCPYSEDVPAWLFALHTWLGIVLRLLAACALPHSKELLVDRRTPLLERMRAFESGASFQAAGVSNLRSGFYGWYVEHPAFETLSPHLQHSIDTLCPATPARSGPDDEWTGDAFRSVYEGLVPQDLRHALGEVYTPDVLVSHALDVLGWRPEDSLLDPTCGMGGFLLEAVRRRIAAPDTGNGVLHAGDALHGLYGFELNPLAVLACRVALVLRLASRFHPSRPTTVPVYLADAIVLGSPISDLELPLDREDEACARTVPRVRCIAGNPPWIKWSQLPPGYAARIRPHCAATNVFARDRYVGGIEADISAVITHVVLDRWLEPGGRLAFYLPAALLSTEAGEGFRRMLGRHGEPLAAFECVEDLQAIRPFQGVSAPAVLMLLRGGEPTSYPVPFRTLEAIGQADSGASYGRERAALPVPGSHHGPWLKGTTLEHALWASLFDAARQADYRARKGVTTDCNGVFFVRVLERQDDLLFVENDPALGRKDGIDRVQAWIEATHVFPLMRGRGLSAFRATADPEHAVIVPQRGMHGDADLATLAPRTWEFLRRFESVLLERGSYRRYQRGKPFWSTWSTGPYTFQPWKVLWKEMSGARFQVAAAGPLCWGLLDERPVVPDHKLYFVPVDSEGEAHFLAGILNAPTMSHAVSSYAAQLSLGVSVVENLRIPRFVPDDAGHARVSAIARELASSTTSAGSPLAELDRLALLIVGGPAPGRALPLADRR